MARGPGHQIPQDILNKYDVNKDGRLDETERAALHQDVQSGKLPRPQLGSGPGHERQRPSAEAILQRFDIDHDGKLDETELTSFLNSAPRPPRGPGAPGGGAPLPPPGEGE